MAAAADEWDALVLADYITDPDIPIEEVAAVLQLCHDDHERLHFTRDFSLDNYNEQQCLDNFRFTAGDIHRLCPLLRIPEWFSTPNRFHAPGT